MFSFDFILLLLLRVWCVSECECERVTTFVGQRTTSCSRFSLRTFTWVPKCKLRSSSLHDKHLYLLSHLHTDMVLSVPALCMCQHSITIYCWVRFHYVQSCFHQSVQICCHCYLYEHLCTDFSGNRCFFFPVYLGLKLLDLVSAISLLRDFLFPRAAVPFHINTVIV